MPFYTKNDHFTKTGSGRNQGKLRRRGVSYTCSIVVAGKREVFELADRFARRLSGSSGRQMGYGELKALEGIVRTVAGTVPAKATGASWLRAYTHAEVRQRIFFFAMPLVDTEKRRHFTKTGSGQT